MADRAAVDASPLIALSLAGHLDLLHVAAEAIIVPRAVADEVRAYGPGDPAARALAATPWLVVVEPVPVPESIAGWDLGAGESAVLAWALANSPADAILDDAEARRCAATHGLRVRGTVGIVLASKVAGRIPAARPVLERLRQVGLWMSDELVAEATALVDE